MQAGPQLVPCFERGVCERGFDYFRRRLVRITSGGAAELEAEVRGTEQYQVIVRRTGDMIESRGIAVRAHSQLATRECTIGT